MSGQRHRSPFEIANGLHWVRAEIDVSLARARSAIERYLDDGVDASSDPAPLHVAAEELRLVRGSLTMIECFGAGMLAQEMLALIDALLAGRAAHTEEAFSALSGATLQLSDYVDLLAHGAADRALVLQPVINELRLAGARPLSTEAELFARQLQAVLQPALPSERPAVRSGVAQALAKRELVTFQTAFLLWFRGDETGAGLERMARIADLVAVNLEAQSLHEFWSGCAALAECLRLQSPDSLDLKRLFGRAGSQLKLLAEGGERAALAALGDAAQQVLFHIAGVPRTSKRAQALIGGLQLDVLLPPLAQITELRRQLRGPNTTILNRVYEEIRRDFAQLKDAIDLAVRTSGRSSPDPGVTRERLRRLAQTVGALGLPAAQRALLNQSGAVSELGSGAQQWMDSAIAILRIEHSLQEALFRTLGRGGGDAPRDYAQIESEVPHGQDLREGVAALVRECLVEFAQLKTSVDGYLKQGESSALVQTPQRLHEISNALRMLGADRASDILAQLQQYTADGRLSRLSRLPGGFERFADAVSYAEVYFEALRDGLPSPERVLDNVAAYVERLDGEVPRPATEQAPAAPVVVVNAVPAPIKVVPAPMSAPVGEGIDPEIREVFVEEAREVLAELAHLLPALKRNPGDREVLTSVRRAFHTLKGSGRMVGALRIGEFAWAVEAMLNRCLDGTLAVRTPVLDVLTSATAALPQLLENFRSGGAEESHAATLIERAGRLAAGGSATEPDLLAVFREDAQDRLGFVRRWLEVQNPAAASVPVEPELVRAFHTLRGSASVVDARAVNRLAGEIEDYLNGLRMRSQTLAPPALVLLADALVAVKRWIDSASVGDTHTAEVADWHARIALLPPGTTAEVTPSIDEEFCLQALGALQTMESQTQAWARAPTAGIAAELRAGLASLGNRARSVRCTSLGEIALALSGRLAEIGTAAPNGGFFASLAEIFEGLYQQLDAYRDGELAADPAPWLAKIQALAVPAVSIDAEVREIFGGEAAELMVALERGRDAWVLGDEKALSVLQRNLHTLKGSARIAGALALGEVAQRLEQELDTATAGSAGLKQARLTAGIGGLHRLLAALRRGEMPPPDEALSEIGRAEAAAPPEPEWQTDFALKPPRIELVEGASLPPVTTAPPATRLEAASEWPTLELSPPVELSLDSIFDASDDTSAAPIDDAIRLNFDSPAPGPLPTPEAPAEASASSAPAADLLLDEPFELVAEPIAAALDETEPAPPSSATTPDVPAPPPAPVTGLPDAPQHVDHEITDVFSAEAAELLEQLDVAFEAWLNGDAGEAVRDIQRALHTLKGGARMAGLEAMGDAVHRLETQVHAASAPGEFPDAARFARLRGAIDGLQQMHDRIHRGEAELPIAPLPTPAAAVPATPSPILAGWSPQLFWRPEEDLTGLAAGRRETARVPVESLDAMLNEAGEISLYRSRLEERNSGLRLQLTELLQTIGRVRDQLRMMDIETEAQIAARGLSVGSRDLDRAADRYGPDFDPLEMDRFSRMQELARTLAESVNDLAALQSTMDESIGETETLLLQQSRINTQLQQGLMGTLMVPFSRQMQRLLRVVRQTAQENGKQADLRFRGAEAELDRNVLERITGPLEHLLRNAVVHGIEDPARRAIANKPVVGAIEVSLVRESGQLLLEVRDDGAGLDLPTIRAKAIELGLLAPKAVLSDSDLARFIFEPGFSTAKQLSQDAGRGIGMDVVASEVKQLGGTLEMRSDPGQGMRFSLRLPLSLAVSQALMVGVGHETYAVPLPSIEGIARIARREVAEFSRDNGPLYAYGGRGYRVQHLADYLGLPRTVDEAEARNVTAILVRLGEDLGSGVRRIAMVVDQLLGNREVVSKAIGPQVSSVPGVAGATLLADGRVVLVLDLPALIAGHARRSLLQQAAGDAEAHAATTRETIMVVDDSVTMRRVAERLLVRNGYRVITARDGLDAIAMLQTELPATLLLDIEMPRADGFEVATFVRNNPRLKGLPIIMITSRSGEKHRERARLLGVDRYLVKPYQEDQLLGEINALRRVH